MSDTAAADVAEETTETELFERSEIRQFEADDIEAGRAIGKMLSALFIYTVIAMSIVALWTVASNEARDAPPAATESGPGH